MISVIIPCHNAEPYLREAIDSALGQEGVELEVIVVDDGSTDDSPAIIQSYGKRLRAFFQENRGACAARNHGLAEARGAYIAFLDADDRLATGALARLREALDKLPSDSCVYGDVVYIDRSGKRTGEGDTTRLPDGMHPVAALIGQNLLTGRLLHRTELIRKVGGFDESLPRGQEFDLHFRLALAGTGFVHQEITALEYRRHDAPGRLSAHGFTGKDPLFFYELNRKHIALLEQKYGQDWPAETRASMAKRMWEIGRGLIYERRKASASWRYLVKACSLVVEALKRR